MIERRRRILAASGVNRRSLDDRAARRDQPVKALAWRQLADRSRRGAPRTHQRDTCEIRPHRFEIDARIERQQSALVELDARAEEVLCGARYDHTRIDELFTLHAG